MASVKCQTITMAMMAAACTMCGGLTVLNEEGKLRLPFIRFAYPTLCDLRGETKPKTKTKIQKNIFFILVVVWMRLERGKRSE